MSTPRSVVPETTTVDRQLAADVGSYLTRQPRQLPSKYLYGDLGSTLFEAICRLPWYDIARAEQQLIDARAADVFARIDPIATVVELGPGSGLKLAALLAARPARPLVVHLVDVSGPALEAAGQVLGPFNDITVVPHETTYEAGLAGIGATATGDNRTLALFLGSNIGNFDPQGADAFLRQTRDALSSGDGLLLGADLLKPEADLLLAYDDPLGVTAAFNLNLLERLNRELDADFNLRQFGHQARWDAAASRIEMHLVSLRHQRVRIPAADLDITFEAGDTIWTESSYKYHADQIVDMLRRAGFATIEQWTESGFALTLAQAY